VQKILKPIENFKIIVREFSFHFWRIFFVFKHGQVAAAITMAKGDDKYDIFTLFLVPKQKLQNANNAKNVVNNNLCMGTCVAEPHHFDAAPAPGKHFDAAPDPTLLYTKPTF
jgi:hypothetical protein